MSVIIECVMHNGAQRFRVVASETGYDRNTWIQFPAALRGDVVIPGDTFEVDSLAPIVSKSGNGLSGYVAGGKVRKLSAQVGGAKTAKVEDLAKRVAGDPVSAQELSDVLGAEGLARPPRLRTDEAGPDVGPALTIEPSGMARMSWRTSWNDDLALQTAATTAYGKLTEALPFMRESFASLYDEAGCKELPADQASTFGRQLRNAVESQPTWPMLREASSMHRALASESTQKLAGAVFDAIGIDKVPVDDACQSDPREIDEAAANMDELLEELGAGDDARANMAEQYSDDRRKSVATREVLLGKAIEKADKNGMLAKAVAKVAGEMKERAEAVRTLRALGFSLEGSGSAQHVDVPDDLVREVLKNPALLAIIKRAGRMLEASNRGGMTQMGAGRCDVVGIVPSGDLARVTPAFRARLASPILAGLALVDLVEHQAQSFEQRGEERMQRGPMLLEVDRSGSMEGRRAEMARGFAVAIVAQCWRDRRPVCVVSFAGAGDQTVATCWPGKPKTLGAAIMAASIGAGGGTEVDSALVRGRDELKRHGLLEKTADAVLITDGIFDPIPAERIAEILPRGGRLFGVGVDVDIKPGHPELAEAWKFDSYARTSVDGVAGKALNTIFNGAEKAKGKAA